MRKITRFLKESYTELRKVVWPTRAKAAKLTVIVIMVTVAMSAFLASVDYGLTKGIEYVIDQSDQSEQPGGTLPEGGQPIQIPAGDGTTQQVPTQ